tara:strand:- start:10823 stop:12913 length:2091 start_codon:yes stop_codon:yes gene_type:complete
VVKIPQLRRILRQWLGSQSPRRSVLQWGSADKTGLLMVCLLIAIISSYKLLAVPDLRPGNLSPANEIAKKDALITDSAALQKKRSELLSLTSVQVIDEQKTNTLEQRLKEKIKELAQYASSNEFDRIEFNLNSKEEIWLSQRTEADKKRWEENVILASQRMMRQGLIKTLAQDQLKASASLQMEVFDEISSPENSIGSKLIASTFKGYTNLMNDPARSKKLFEEQIPKHLVKKGDLISEKGKPITEKQYDILAHFGLINRRPRPLEWFCKFLEVLASCGILLLIMRREKPRLKARQALLSLGLLLIVQTLIDQSSKLWFGAAISPLAIIVPPTLLLSQGIGTTSALAWMAISSLIWPIPPEAIGVERLILASTAAGLIAFLGGKMRSRAQLLQIAVLLPFLAFSGEWFLLRSQISPIRTSEITSNAETLVSEAFVVGAMLMITILLIPILENTFGLLTRARLMELADKERPLLRRLSREAPGTFEHTLTILGLAEEGARSIDADIDLIRTGALYHDVGKLHAPKWFIENQENGINPHDELKNPFKSADVLQAHVDEGLKLARRNRLPSAIADFIPEHQGTLKMGYFLHQAREKDPTISEERFRYKGPIPQSKETGILMLADGCEAALRSLEAQTSNKQAQLTVRKIVESRQRDGQLIQSSLTRAEIELVIQGFVRVWRRMRHRRLKYPINTQKRFN